MTTHRPDDNRQTLDRGAVQRLQDAVSQTRQSIVQTQAVIHEALHLIELAKKIGQPAIRLENKLEIRNKGRGRQP
jgi:hypothetical protein